MWIPQTFLGLAVAAGLAVVVYVAMLSLMGVDVSGHGSEPVSSTTLPWAGAVGLTVGTLGAALIDRVRLRALEGRQRAAFISAVASLPSPIAESLDRFVGDLRAIDASTSQDTNLRWSSLPREVRKAARHEARRVMARSGRQPIFQSLAKQIDLYATPHGADFRRATRDLARGLLAYDQLEVSSQESLLGPGFRWESLAVLRDMVTAH